MSENLIDLENKINYKFKNRIILETAVTHSSWANEHSSQKNNERLEFLGDAVVSLSTAEFLFEKYPDVAEGRLSKMRASLVCTASLSSYAKQINLGSFLKLGHGEEESGGRQRSTNLENAFEALCGAIYLDGGFEAAKGFIISFHQNAIEDDTVSFTDYKSRLQELVQRDHEETLQYQIIGESGPPHDKKYEAVVKLNSNIMGKGSGRSKKKAEQAAAKDALELMGL